MGCSAFLTLVNVTANICLASGGSSWWCACWRSSNSSMVISRTFSIVALALICASLASHRDLGLTAVPMTIMFVSPERIFFRVVWESASI